MKYLVLALLIVSCTTAPTTPPLDEPTPAIDSLLTKSQRSIDSATVAITKTDNAVVQKVEKTVQKIGKLENEVKELKAENNELKEKLDDAVDDGKPYSGLPVSSY